MSTWKDGEAASTWRAEWSSITTFLINSGYDLKVPIAKEVYDEDATFPNRKALKEMIFKHYKDEPDPLMKLADTMGMHKATLCRKLKDYVPWTKKQRDELCMILGITPEEEEWYFS